MKSGLAGSFRTATLGLGKLYRRTGKRDQAQEHLATTATMYREMDMRLWLGQADGEMNGLA